MRWVRGGTGAIEVFGQQWGPRGVAVTGKVDRNQLERLERVELEDHVYKLLTELQDAALAVLDGFDEYDRKEAGL